MRSAKPAVSVCVYYSDGSTLSGRAGAGDAMTMIDHDACARASVASERACVFPSGRTKQFSLFSGRAALRWRRVCCACAGGARKPFRSDVIGLRLRPATQET